MRFTIILTLCFLGVASASSLNKRSFVDDFQNNTQNAFKAFEQFGQSFNDKLQEALKNLMDAFGQKQQSEASVSVTKRDIQENLKKFTEEAKKNAKAALKQLFDLFESMKPKAEQPAEATTEAAVEKRDVQEELKQLSENAKINAEKSVSELVKFFEKFQAQASNKVGKAVSKRDIQESIEKFNKLAQTKAQEAFENMRKALEKLLNVSPFFNSIPNQIAEDSTEKSVAKRDVFDSFEKFSKNAYEKFMSTFEHYFNKLAGDEEDIAYEDQATESSY